MVKYHIENRGSLRGRHGGSESPSLCRSSKKVILVDPDLLLPRRWSAVWKAGTQGKCAGAGSLIWCAPVCSGAEASGRCSGCACPARCACLVCSGVWCSGARRRAPRIGHPDQPRPSPFLHLTITSHYLAAMALIFSRAFHAQTRSARVTPPLGRLARRLHLDSLSINQT